MAVLKKIKRAVRGEVKLTTVAREALRRTVASVNERKERAGAFDNEPLALKSAFARMSENELLAHFRGPREAKFLDSFSFATDESISSADRIVDDHSWALLGFGERCFGEPSPVGSRSSVKVCLAARLSPRCSVDALRWLRRARALGAEPAWPFPHSRTGLRINGG